MAVDDGLALKLSKSRAAALAQEMSTTVREASRARRSLDDKVAAWWERFEGEKPKRTLTFDRAANIRVMLTYWTVRQVWVRTLRTIFGQSPTIMVGDENLAYGPDAGLAQEALEHLLITDLAFRRTAGHALLNSFIEPVGVLKLGRASLSRTIRDREGDDLVERQVLDRVGLTLDAIDFKDFWVANPAIVDVDQQPWVAHRVWLRWDDILRRQRDGVYPITKKQLNDLKPRTKTRRTSSESGALEQVKADLDKSEDSGAGTGLEEYEVFEIRARRDVDDDGLEEECLFTIAADYLDTPLRAQLAPWWNGKRGYFIYRPLPRANRFYGLSMAGILQGQQDVVDMRVNQNLDANSLAILAALTPILPRTLKQEWEKHKWELAKPVYLDSPETFATLGSIMRHNPITANVDVQQELDFSQRTSGVTEPFLAQPAGARTTAFEISTIQHEGNVNFQEMIEQIQDTNREIGYQVLEHAYQLAQEAPEFRERLIRVSGNRDPFEGLTLRDLRQRWDLKPYGNTIVANKDLEAKKSMAAFQLFREDGFVNADLSHARYLRERVLKGIGFNTEEIDKILGTVEELEAFKQQMAQTAMMQAQQQIAGAATSEPGNPGEEGGQAVLPGPQ